MSVLGDRIKQERKKLNLTREELAKILGVSYSAIAMYEQGNREPNNELNLKMCKLFNCSMDYLIGLTSYKNPKKTLEEIFLDFNLSKEEFLDIKELLERYNYSLNKILNNKNIDSKTFEIIKSICSFAFDYDKSQMISKLNAEPTETNSVIFPSNISNEYLTKELDNIEKITSKKLKRLIDKIDEKNFFQDASSKFYMCPVYGQISAGQPNWAEECIEGRLPIDPSLMDIVDPEECFFLRVNGESMNKVVRNGSYALIRKTDYAEDGDIVVAIVNGNNEATLKRFKRFNEQFVSFEPMSSDESFKPINVDLKTTNVVILGKYIGKFEMNK